MAEDANAGTPRLMSGIAVAERAVPVPVSGTDCGLPAASSVTLMLALRAQADAGVKRTVSWHEAPAPSVAGESGQVVCCEKSAAFAPVSAIALMERGALPLFVSETPRVALGVPTICPPKSTLAGLKVTAGAVVVPALKLARMFAVTRWMPAFA